MQRRHVQRLIQIIIEELAALPASAVAERCSCHSVLSECCPERLRGMLDAGATRLGLHATGGATGGVAAMIDHTLLKPDATRKDIETLCREAAEYKFASVCVNPTWVAACARLLQGTGCGSVRSSGFRSARRRPTSKHYETRRAIFDGACEIDMVINIGALKSGEVRLVERDIEAVTSPCREAGVVSKVIIEAALADRRREDDRLHAGEGGRRGLRQDLDRLCGRGRHRRADVALMRRVVGEEMGVKAAGGVRDLEGLKAMVAAGATRGSAPAPASVSCRSRADSTRRQWGKGMSPKISAFAARLTA